MKFEIKHRLNGEVLFSVKTESWRFAVEAAIKAKANLSWANLSWANLSWADLSKANLSGANLSKADLSKANLSGANLSKADLSGADLSGADLSKANLSGANLSKADLSGADLSWADLSVICADFWSILLFAQDEIPALRKAIIDGKIDGSTYEGDCACLCGTIANERKCSVNELDKIVPDSSRPAERFFMGIKPGDKPDTNPASKIALQWLDEFVKQTSKVETN